jgi:hypothetical protein
VSRYASRACATVCWRALRQIAKGRDPLEVSTEAEAAERPPRPQVPQHRTIAAGALVATGERGDLRGNWSTRRLRKRGFTAAWAYTTYPVRPKPREITHWSCGGRGVHRFTFDGRYAYLSPELDGYLANIVMILDLIDPAHTREIGRWWLPGQWIAGGESPT